jgi:hypothetical protein
MQFGLHPYSDGHDCVPAVCCLLLYRLGFVAYETQITEVRKNTLPSARGVGVGQMVRGSGVLHSSSFEHCNAGTGRELYIYIAVF